MGVTNGAGDRGQASETIDAQTVSNNRRVRDLAGSLVQFILALADTKDIFTVAELREKFGNGFNDGQFNRAFWSARTVLRDDYQMDFAPVRGMPGCYQRVSGVATMARADRMTQKGVRTIRRGGSFIHAVNEAELSPEDRERLRAKKDKHGFRETQMRQIFSLRKPLPSGNDVQPEAAPRRGARS